MWARHERHPLDHAVWLRVILLLALMATLARETPEEVPPTATVTEVADNPREALVVAPAGAEPSFLVQPTSGLIPEVISNGEVVLNVPSSRNEVVLFVVEYRGKHWLFLTKHGGEQVVLVPTDFKKISLTDKAFIHKDLPLFEFGTDKGRYQLDLSSGAVTPDLEP